MGYELRHRDWYEVYPVEALAVAEQVGRLLVAARDRRMAWVQEVEGAVPLAAATLCQLAQCGVLYSERRKVFRGGGNGWYWGVFVDPREVLAYCSLSQSEKRDVRRGWVTLAEASGWVLAEREWAVVPEGARRETRQAEGDWLPSGKLPEWWLEGRGEEVAL